jgi:hypothetical protein
VPPIIPAVIVGVACLAAIAGIIDALRQPDEAWDAAEQSRRTWIAVLAVLPIAAPAYWLSIRKQLTTA